MTESARQNSSQPWGAGSRASLPLTGDERQILTACLDWQRQTFELKCVGITTEGLSDKPIPPSELSMHGLVRHLAGVERWWFQVRFSGADVPRLYNSNEEPHQDFDDLAGDVEQAFAVWRTECDRSREIVSNASLEQTGTLQNGEPISLRRILVDMIAEYARHNGHVDLLRERIDGATGF